jgi:hypothetical protein
MKTNRLRQNFYVVLAILLAFITLGFLSEKFGYEKNSLHLNTTNIYAASAKLNASQTLEYKVWRVFPPSRGGYALALVSVSPKHFNKDDMTILANQLNKDYSKEIVLKAVLFDDESIPRNFLLGGVEISTLYKEQRGLYFIDRKKCKEYIQFYADKKKPKSNIVVNFKCSSPKEKN